MKQRIAMWAAAGFFVAGCWVLCTLVSNANQWTLGMWILVTATCPITLARSWQLPMSWVTVLLVNAATYAAVGLLVERLRQRTHRV